MTRVTLRVAGILWDNDGVLVDTEPLYLQASREILASIGIELSDEQYREISLVRGASVFELAQRRGMDDEAVRRLRARRDRRYSELLRRGVPARVGARECLKALAGRVRMGIVTSSQRQHFELIHAQTRLLPLFEFALVREDYCHSKPDPEPYLLGASRLGLPAENILVVEDTVRGLCAARAAGLRCLVVPSELSGGDGFEGAEQIVESMVELTGVLSKLIGG